MPNVFATSLERDEFLAEPRQAILISNRTGESPIGVPVWYEWTGTEILMFSGRGTPKLKRITADPNVMVLVTNNVGENEAWVSFEGEMEIVDHEDPWPLVERMAPRYWNIEEKRETLNTWKAGKAHLVLLRMKPTKIKSGH